MTEPSVSGDSEESGGAAGALVEPGSNGVAEGETDFDKLGCHPPSDH